jgi:type VI secretion system secreted protein Hcp
VTGRIGFLDSRKEAGDMAVDIFLDLDGVQGESKDKDFKDKIDIFSFSWGASNTGSGHYGHGSGAGKGVISDLSVMTQMGKHTPTLYKFCMQGKHIAKGTLSARKAAGDNPLVYGKWEMEEILITSIQTSGSGEIPTESISLNFRKIHHTYHEQSATGSDEAAPEVTIDAAENTTT